MEILVFVLFSIVQSMGAILTANLLVKKLLEFVNYRTEPACRWYNEREALVAENYGFWIEGIILVSLSNSFVI